MNLNKLYKQFTISTGVCTDSRKIQKGQIFFAIRGENFNGNEFAAKAIEQGASLAVIDDDSYKKDDSYIVVPDVLKCLQDLAAFHRKSMGIPVIAITGSNGKTTTKELSAAVLSKKYNVHYTEGNLNNHIGVPLTLLAMKDAEIAIIEMGANHKGEIKELCKIADPDYGLITNIGKAHLKGFGSIEGVLEAKSELYRYLESGNSRVFVNGSNEMLNTVLSGMDIEKTSYFSGTNCLCDGYAQEKSDFLKAHIRFMEGKEWETATQLTGNYNLENVLAASCIGKYFGVEEADIISALENYQPGNNRSQLLKTSANILIMDAYNANPNSMREALENFNSMEAGNKMVILGEMAELGDSSENEHMILLEALKKYKFDKTWLSGAGFYAFKNKYPFRFFKNTREIHEQLIENPVSDHLILLKSSRTGKLEILKDYL